MSDKAARRAARRAWTRTVDHSFGDDTQYLRGRYGHWTYQQFTSHTGAEHRFTEDEMQAIDALMRRVCDVDRSGWQFMVRREGDPGWSVYGFQASHPRMEGWGYHAETLGDFLRVLELRFLDGKFRRWVASPHVHACPWCDRPIEDAYRRPDMLAQLKHCEDAHPDETAAVRAEREAELERLRDYYRRNRAHREDLPPLTYEL